MARKVAVVKNPKTVGDAMHRAAVALGPTLFCASCYGWANTWHVCSFPMGQVFAPSVATLDGGLTADEPECLCLPTLDEVHPYCRAHTLEPAEATR